MQGAYAHFSRNVYLVQEALFEEQKEEGGER